VGQLKMKINYYLLFIVQAWALLSYSCNSPESKGNNDPQVYDQSPTNIGYKVINVYPHDTTSYTEGFLIHDGVLFEATGHTNSFPSSRSIFGIVNLVNGVIDKKVEIDKKKYFGEGIAFIKDRVYQLTDTTHVGFVYDAKTYKLLGIFNYDGEGWGLTTNGTDLLMSNGSSNIFYRDPVTFKIIKTIAVTDNNGPTQNLNELELINGYLYANQWQTDYILKIDTNNGKVIGRIDLSALKKEAVIRYFDAQETNGIAFDSATNKIYVTGKLWPEIYQIQFDH
jgi:glutaminyl-peptide cyclotransferase